MLLWIGGSRLEVTIVSFLFIFAKNQIINFPFFVFISILDVVLTFSPFDL